ncbi:MAG: histidinol dehydrogenase [Helicobacteraceae bacterium]|jgi:histidinol dehydrogenase|nr:histidinol dehydrogenase [Helicobacteraceae bacterium]
MKIVKTTDKSFGALFEGLLKRGRVDLDAVYSTVAALLEDVKQRGDAALIDQCRRFDRWEPQSIEDIIISASEMKTAWENSDQKMKTALSIAFNRVKSFHKKQLQKSWIDFSPEGWLGQKITPVDRAGLYIPGGKAAYPSSLLMCAAPAIAAGVDTVVACVPSPNGRTHPAVLAAAHLCGIKKAFKIGGAGAIGALAYGTASVPKVEALAGPGNIYVAAAKKQVFGEVNVDMIAGPSEIGIIADESADADLVAIDMLSQAEHDEMASAILITTSQNLAEKTLSAIYEELKGLEREEIAAKSIENRGAIIVAKSIDEAIDLMNLIAPEHLEILTRSPHELLGRIKSAGAIFLGSFSPEAVGDYAAGPNHTLPTGGTARFFSALGVENFVKRSSIISLTKEGFSEISGACAALAKIEGLTAHRKSILKRLEGAS